MLSITLDWLAFTFREDTVEQQEFLHTYASSKGALEITATNGYRTAYRTAQGVAVQWNADRPEMGYHVIISGSAIRHILSDYKLEQKALVQSVLHVNGSITRLDLAKDLTDTKADLDSIYKALERGEHSGTARKFAQIHSLNGGNTIYVGSRQSEKFIRIYDKAAQEGLPGQLWIRFELETKGMVARALATLLIEQETWTGAFDTMARHMVNLPHLSDYAAFFAAGVVPIGIPKLEKQTDREAWIEKQVIPAVVKHFIEHRSSASVALLRAMLDQIEASSGGLDTTKE